MVLCIMLSAGGLRPEAEGWVESDEQALATERTRAGPLLRGIVSTSSLTQRGRVGCVGWPQECKRRGHLSNPQRLERSAEEGRGSSESAKNRILAAVV